MARASGWALAAWAGVAVASACSDEPPPPSGRFGRPTGLLAIDRSPERTDVFITDAEAGGVRLLQLKNGAEDEEADSLVPGPVGYFPLAISAPGFPTRLTASLDGRRAYVAGAVSGALEVLSTEELPFGGRVTANPGNEHLGSIDLAEVFGEPIAIVDLEILPAAGGGRDRLVLVGEPLARPGAGVLASLDIDPARLEATLTATRAIGGAPSDLVVRTATPTAILASSGLDSSVHGVHFDPATGALGAAFELPAGGPTRGLVDMGAAGLLALMLDRPSIAVFERTSAGLRRVEHPPATPYRPVDELGDGGYVDLEAPVVAGSHARLTTLPAPASTLVSRDLLRPEDRGADGKGDVVFIAQLDGKMLFLVGFPPRMEEVTSARPSRIDPGETDAKLRECTFSTPLSCESFVTASAETLARSQPVCADTVTAVPIPSTRRYELRYRGALAKNRGGSLRPLADGVVGASLHLSLTDSTERDFTNQLISVGDEGLFQLKANRGCADGPTVEVVATATVVAVAPGAVRLAFAADSPIRELCTTRSLQLHSYELYPSGGDVVLAELESSGRVTRAVERVAPREEGGVTLAVVERELALTLTSSTGFGCASEPTAPPSCFRDADCSQDGVCLASEVESCPGICTTRCNPTDPRCLASGVVRVCTGLTLDLAPPLLADATPVASEFYPALPEGIQYVPARQTWFVTVPGARAIALVRARAELITAGFIR